MLTHEQEERLVREVIGSAEAMGQAMSPNTAAMIVSDLSEVPFAAAMSALRAARTQTKGRLTFAVIREKLVEQDGRPAANEAWSLALQASDERDSVVWTPEIQAALDAARPILRGGDKIGARMAFISAYERLVQTARDSAKPCEWVVSIGWDVELRERALESAVTLQRLPLERAKALGYGQAQQAITADGRAILGLLAGSSSTGLLALTTDEKTREALLAENERTGKASPAVKEKLRVLRLELERDAKRKERQRRIELERNRRDLRARKEQAQLAASAHAARQRNDERSHSGLDN